MTSPSSSATSDTTPAPTALSMSTSPTTRRPSSAPKAVLITRRTAISSPACSGRMLSTGPRYEVRAGRRVSAYAGPVERSRTRPAGLIIAAVLTVGGAVGAWACWRYFVDTQRGQLLDNTAFRGSEIGRSTLWTAAQPVLDIVSVSFVVVVVGIATVMALIRGRWLRVIQIAVLVGGANVTTQVLKHEVFERPFLSDAVGTAGNSLPSGHTTVAASVAAVLLIAVPAWLRPVTAVGGAAYTALTGVSTMVGGWHRPSDVVAAIAVVVAWAGIATMITATDRSEGHRPRVAFLSVFATVALGVAATIALAIGAPMLLRVDRALAAEPWLDNRDLLADAYVGSGLAVVAASAIAFALMLVAHHIAARPGPDGADRHDGHDRANGATPNVDDGRGLRHSDGRPAEPYPLS